jgi:hypothetical protein
MTAVSMHWRVASILDFRTFAAFWGEYVSPGRRWAQGGDGAGEKVGLGIVPWGGYGADESGAGEQFLGRRWDQG